MRTAIGVREEQAAEEVDGKGIPVVFDLEDGFLAEIDAVKLGGEKIFGADGTGIGGELPGIHVDPEHGRIFVQDILVAEIANDEAALMDGGEG